MEYAPDKVFEDRRSIRVLNRPEAMPFTKNFKKEGIYYLSTPRFTLAYKPDGCSFHSENLWALDNTSQRIFWRHGQQDTQNLGGVHLGMDCIQREVIPHGVHTATSDYHPNNTSMHLWNYVFGEEGSVDSDAHYAAGMATLEQLVRSKSRQEMPPGLQKLLAEREHYPPGILSREGYFLYNDSNKAVLSEKGDWIENRNKANNMDLYLFYYEDQYQEALKDYITLFGPSPLLPRYSMGLWYSRYPTFDEKGLRKVIEDFEQHNLPLDLLVVDLEWHKRGWFGYDWDTSHIQDPQGFLDFLQSKGIHTTFNVHPNGIPLEDSRFKAFCEAAGIEVKKSGDPEEIFHNFDFANQQHAQAFMDIILKPVQDQGVDFWWIDGDVPAKGIDVEHQLWTNEVYQRHIAENYPNRRPMIFSRTGGLGTHRYPFHFTGDTYCQWEVLQSQVEYTLRAGHIGQSYMTHDIGGHMNPYHYTDPELYTRWVQFGVLSPLFRLHSAGGGERRPWEYDNLVLKAFKKALLLRMELLPYLYTMSRITHDQGLPLCRSNPLSHPQWEEGYSRWDSYYLGDRIYAAPVVTPGGIREVLLPSGFWYNALNGKKIYSDGKTPNTYLVANKDIPFHFVKGGRILIKQKYCLRAEAIPQELIIEIYPIQGKNQDYFTLYEDDGKSQNFEQGLFGVTEFRYHQDEDSIKLIISALVGDFQGKPLTRSYQIRVYGEQRVTFKSPVIPKEVDFSKDEDENIALYQSFLLPKLSTEESIVLEASLGKDIEK